MNIPDAGGETIVSAGQYLPRDLSYLDQCDREPVQFPGAILPQGVLLVLDPLTRQLAGVSANASALLGLTPRDILGAGLARVFTPDDARALESALSQCEPGAAPRFIGCVQAAHAGRALAVQAHCSGASILLECEPVDADLTVTGLIAHAASVQRALARLQSDADWGVALASAVDEIRRITGFDSVLGVRFLDDGSAHAVAESRNDRFPSYLDKRFPRSDIPEPGRRQMERMPVQHVADHAYEPVPLLMLSALADPARIDLGLSVLRSVSPMCSRYYLNMGARSRLLLTLLDRGRLWGFINCLGREPRHVSFAERLAFRSFVDSAAPLVAEKARADEDRTALDMARSVAEITRALARASGQDAAVHVAATQLQALLDLTLVVARPERRIVAGAAPDSAFVDALVGWLDGQPEGVETDRLATLFPPAAAHGAVACGLLSLPLSGPGELLIALRPEWVHEVRWAGDPRKPVELDAASGSFRLSPRGSFDEWRETVRGRARPWARHEIAAIGEFRQALLMAQADAQGEALRARLVDSNQELESFAYTVSHDLQEPLRGIANFSRFLRERGAEHLGPEERGWLDTIIKLSQRMSEQVEALLQYSRASQRPLERQVVDLDQLLQSVREDLGARIAAAGARIVVPRPLPVLDCDPVRTRAVLENLVVNALKYNDSAEKRVEIGWNEGTPPVLWVRDNGIGIAPEHREDVFAIFRRLHGRNAYGGGTGAGLTLARKHVERHGGRIWLESEPGAGSCFFFTLGPAQAGELPQATGSDRA